MATFNGRAILIEVTALDNSLLESHVIRLKFNLRYIKAM